MKTRFGIVKMAKIAACALAAGLITLPAIADTQPRAGQPTVPCTCRFQGQDYQLGDKICLNLPNGPQQAECGFVLNNTSWNMTGTSCLYSEIPTEEQLATKIRED